MKLSKAILVSTLGLAAVAAPASAETTGHHHPTFPATIHDLALADDGDVWFSEVGTGSARIVRLDPDTDATTTTAVDMVVNLTVGLDGTVWFTSYSGGLNSLDPTTGTVTPHPYVTGDSDGIATYAVSTGPDGTIWFTDANAAGIGWVDPDTGAVDFVTDPSVALSLSPDVVVAGDGSVWYSVPAVFGVGLRRFDPGTETFSEVADPGDLLEQPYALTVDSAGDVWFGDMESNSIGRVDVETASVASAFTNEAIAAVIDDDGYSQLSVADDGTIWFVGEGGIGRMETQLGAARSVPYLLEGDFHDWVLNPWTVTADPAGGVWLGAEDVVAHHEPTCNGQPVTVDPLLVQEPTDGNDVILGTPGDDHLEGGDGNDVICGLGGDDQLGGGPGRDRIFGGAGADGLKADAGGGLLAGGEGNDALIGGGGADDLRGGPGNDAIDARRGNDRVDGGAGGNGCDGGPGKDVVIRCLPQD